jgi:Co/Zn/Cd efflux system component
MSESCGHQHGACCSSHEHQGHEPAIHSAKGQGHAEEACGCHGGVPVFDGVDPRYKRVLWTVIAINATLFVTEIVAGHLAVRRPCRPTPSISSATPSPMA